MTGALCIRFLFEKEMVFIQDFNSNSSNNRKLDKSNASKDLLNEAIRFPVVLLIGPSGEQLGKMSAREAQYKANSYDMDLLCVAANANPPVCKIINYSKYRFEQQKRAKEAKKNQKIIEIKEVQLTPQIGMHDMETKARHATKFLQDGNKVKVGVRFRGRQMAHVEVGQETLDKFIELVSDYAVIEKTASMDGKWLVAVLAPKKK